MRVGVRELIFYLFPRLLILFVKDDVDWVEVTIVTYAICNLHPINMTNLNIVEFESFVVPVIDVVLDDCDFVSVYVSLDYLRMNLK